MVGHSNRHRALAVHASPGLTLAPPATSGSNRSTAATAPLPRQLTAISNVRWGSGDAREGEATAILWTLWGVQAENATQFLGKGSHVNERGRAGAQPHLLFALPGGAIVRGA